MQRGVAGGKFAADQYWGVYGGIVANRDDPEGLGRVKVSIPGLIDEESNWALPRTGGAKNWGSIHIPPVGADVFVQFLNGDIDHPIWEPGPFGRGEEFPEHESADVSVWGVGPFRLVVDNRDGVKTATFKVVRVVSGSEESVCELLFNADTNSVRLFATSAIQVESGGILDVDSNSVQVRGRKVMPVNRPIN